MNREDKKWQAYEKYRFEASKNGNMQIWSFNQYSALWDQLTIDRRKGKSRSHESIAEQINYKSEFEVSRSVGRRRFNIIKEKDSNITLNDVKRMSSDEYNKYLKSLGIDVSQLYKDILQKNLQSGMDMRQAKKATGRELSHSIYGSP